MAAKDSSSDCSCNIFGGKKQVEPPTSEKTVTQRRDHRISSTFGRIGAHLKKWQTLIEQVCSVMKAIRKLLVVVSSIILILGIMWTYFNSSHNDSVVISSIVKFINRFNR